MALTKYRLGDLIEQRKEKYDGLENLPIRGVSREGFIHPKQEGANTDIYNVFYKCDFVFNPARMELNSIALNTIFDKAICSSLYEVFYVTRKDILLPQYLNLYIKRDEFARKCWFEAIGSARNYFRVPALSEFEIDVPDIEIQQKYVDIYNAMLANQKAYEQGLDDLKLTCDAYIEDLRRNTACQKIGQYLYESDARNTIGLGLEKVRGLATSKELIQTKADMDGVKLDNYKLIKPRQIAYVADTSRRGDKISMGFNDTDDTFLVSSISIVFETDVEHLLPEYLMLFLTRSEFDRYARFHSWGSARETFTWNDLIEVKIPIPSIEVQKSISDVYTAYKSRKQINEQLKLQIKGICPILIKGSLEEARKQY